MKMLKKILTLALVATLLLALAACGNTSDKDTYTVGICQLLPHPALDAATKGFMESLQAELGAENVTFLNENAGNEINVCTTIITNHASSPASTASTCPSPPSLLSSTITINHHQYQFHHHHPLPSSERSTPSQHHHHRSLSAHHILCCGKSSPTSVGLSLLSYPSY